MTFPSGFAESDLILSSVNIIALLVVKMEWLALSKLQTMA